MKMSLIPSSKGTAAALVALVIAMAAVGTAVAVDTTDISAPEEVEVGEEVTAEVTITELYQPDNDWTLRGTTQLQNISSWQVTQTYPNGTEVSETFEGQSQFELEVTSSENFESIEVSITGDAPPVDEYTYDPPQTFEAAKLTKVIGEGESNIETVEVHHYTNESRTAWNAISEAQEVVEDSGNAEAENRLQQAISAYESKNFGNAESIANDAKKTAEESQQSEETMTLVLYGIGALVVLALIGGGIYYYRNQQDSYDKLR
jgi:hypothetical protein